MKVLPVEQNSEDWYMKREGLITGSRVTKMLTMKHGEPRMTEEGEYKPSSSLKKEQIKWILYQLGVSYDYAYDDEFESATARGHRLEPIALQTFADRTGYDLRADGMWVSSENENLGISPDAFVPDKKIKIAVEVKCMYSTNHFAAWLGLATRDHPVPEKYRMQIMQYFVVNPDLQDVYMVFYCPEFSRYPQLELFYIRVPRSKNKKIIANSRNAQEIQMKYLLNIANRTKRKGK